MNIHQSEDGFTPNSQSKPLAWNVICRRKSVWSPDSSSDQFISVRELIKTRALALHPAARACEALVYLSLSCVAEAQQRVVWWRVGRAGVWLVGAECAHVARVVGGCAARQSKQTRCSSSASTCSTASQVSAATSAEHLYNSLYQLLISQGLNYVSL